MALRARIALAITAVFFTFGAKCDQASLYFSLMVSNSTSSSTTSLLSAIDQTLAFINDDPTILQGYHLQHGTVLQHQCNFSRAQKLFLTEQMAGKFIHAVIGCGCSSATEQVAELSQFFGIPMIAYASTSSVLSDTSMYYDIFRTVPSDEILAPALALLMNYYSWKKVIILTQTTLQHQENLLNFKSVLNSVNVTAINFDPRENLTFLIESESLFGVSEHVYVMNMETNQVYFFLCQAYHNGRYYPNYLWITINWLQRDWWTTVSQEYLDTINCTTSEIQQVLYRSLMLLSIPNNQESLANSAIKVSWVTNSSPVIGVEDYARDALLALALSLNNTLCWMGDSNSSSLCQTNTSLEDEIQRIQFNGFSGPVLFTTSGNRPSDQCVLQQYQFTSEESTLALRTVATINETHFLYADSENNETVFPDGIPPDGTPLTVVVSVESIVITLTTIMMITGLIFAGVCLAFNIIYRNRRVVKLTSPSLSYVMILGLVMVLLAVATFPITDPLKVKVDCIAKAVLLSTGYDISFSVALVKLFRVWYIFNNPLPRKKVPLDWHLILIVVAIVGADVLLAAPFNIVYALKVNIMYGFYESSVNERGVEEIAVISLCSDSLVFDIWSYSTALFKFVLNTVGMLLVILTRNVKVTILNEANYTIAIIIANIIFMIMIVTLLSVVDLSMAFSLWRIVWGTMLFIAATIFLGLTFVPKMLALYKDPEGKHIFQGDDEELKQSSLQHSTSIHHKDSTVNTPPYSS